MDTQKCEIFFVALELSNFSMLHNFSLFLLMLFASVFEKEKKTIAVVIVNSWKSVNYR